MSDKTFKVGEEIKIVYQTPGSVSDLVVNMEIYDETGVKDLVNFPDVVLAEVGTSGKYRGSFTPDAEGNWEIHVATSTNDGKLVKQYSVGGYNLDGIGDLVSATGDAIITMDAHLTTVEEKINNIDSPPMLG